MAMTFALLHCYCDLVSHTLKVIAAHFPMARGKCLELAHMLNIYNKIVIIITINYNNGVIVVFHLSRLFFEMYNLYMIYTV